MIRARLVVQIDPPESLWAVLQSGGACGLNIDSHTQGMFHWRLQAACAAQANLAIWHGSKLDLGLFTAAQLQLAASAPNCTLPGDQISPWFRQSTLLKEPFRIEDGCTLVPRGSGLGVTVDPEALDRYTVSHVSWELRS